MWLIGVEVEQETSAPPPKKNPGSAPVEDLRMLFWRSKSTLVCYTAVFSVVTQRSSSLWGGALRDDTKKGCVAD